MDRSAWAVLGESGAGTGQRGVSSRQVLTCLLLLLSVGAGLRILQFRGFGGVDDFAYAQLAHEIAEGRSFVGQYDGPAAFPLRVGIIAPTALAFKAFGVSEWTLVAFPFLLSLLGILLAYACTAFFFGPGTGLIGAAIWAVFPLDSFYASGLVPDLPAAFFLGLGVLTLLVALKRGPGPRWLPEIAGVGAGLLLGMSWLCKETLAFSAPFFAFLAFGTLRAGWRKNGAVWLGLAGGSLAVLFSEALAYRIMTGDWLFHLHEVERNYAENVNAFLFQGSGQIGDADYLKSILRRVILDGPQFLLTNPQYGYLPLVGVLAMGHALLNRRREALVPAVWLLTLLFMFNFAPSSTRSYAPLALSERYFYPMALPSVVLTAGLLGSLFVAPQPGDARLRRERLFWGSLLAAGLLLAFAGKNRANHAYRPDWMDATRAASAVLEPRDRVYADVLTLHGLEFFWSFPEDMNVVNLEEMPGDGLPEEGSRVLLNRTHLEWLKIYAGWWPTKGEEVSWPAFVDSPPSAWERVWSGSDATLFRVQ